ncbi:hypothetical protein ACPFT9_003475 [Vibrio cholerae]|uniref:hypothetical protein n=1 Tax=Vibrio cholerae TaxID=666 RepID=UPI00227400C4|nr:hypothetical protein [Vibrio cholerae]EKE8763092.1 hypothetical protein [Vibrio cholerae]ELF1354375.1 hypothetical protein [Vibrio cholerae]MDV2383728.1 hypothetical protein [Vibrio cholerae]
MSESNNLKSITVAILIAIVSTTFGFFISDYLDREKVSIAHIGIKPKEVTISASAEFKKHATNVDEYGLYPLIFRKGAKEQYSVEHIKSMLENVSREKIALNESLVTFREDLEVINAMKNTNPDLALFYKIASKYLESFDSEDKLDMISAKIEIKIGQSEERLKKINDAIKVIVNEALRSNREQEFQISVIILNAGKTQALVRNSGYLKFGEDVIYLKQASSVSDSIFLPDQNLLSNTDFVVVKEKEFNSINLIVDKYNNRQRMLDLVKREYLNGSRNAQLVLKDSKNEEIYSETFIFRNDLEENRKITLREYLESHYREYIDNTYIVSN